MSETRNSSLLERIALVLILCCYMSGVAFASADGPPVQWHKTFGGGARDWGRSVKQTFDGGYIIAGETYSFGAGSGDVYLIKTDPNGNSQWQKTFGRGDRDRAYSVQQTSDGGYIIAGTVGFVPWMNLADVYLIKTDPNGNSQWEKTYGGSRDDGGNSVQQTADGGYVIVGGISYDFLRYKVYLIKTDPNGNIQWEKTFGGNYNDVGYSVQQTADGGYIIVGDSRSFEGDDPDVYLIKTEPNGNSQWQKKFGGSSDEWGWSVKQTLDGGYIIAGETWSFGAGGGDAYLVKTDSNGNSQWQKTFGGSDDDGGYSVQQAADGGYIIAGWTDSFGAGSENVYLIKTDPNGNLQWQKTVGGSFWDYGYSVQQTIDEGYVIAGYTHSFGAGFDDVYLIKLCSDGTLAGDLNCNSIINFEDVAILVSQWLQPRSILYPPADIYGTGDGIVNFFDFVIMAEQWMEEE